MLIVILEILYVSGVLLVLFCSRVTLIYGEASVAIVLIYHSGV